MRGGTWCLGGVIFPDGKYANFLRFIFVDALAASYGAVLL
jgi:hypothetical protein